MRIAATVVGLFIFSTTVAVARQQPGAQQPAAPAGPMAPEKYKNIQVLTDVPAAQLDDTMQFFMAATGISCAGCHVRDQATGQFSYDLDTQRSKQTARRMIQLVKTVNAGDFGARINCATCHQGRNQPAGLQPAIPLTADQIAALAARAGGPPAAGAPGGAGRGAPGGGGGNAPAAPPLDDLIAKYVTAMGGQAAIEKVTSIVMTGTLVNRANQSAGFTIEQKGLKYRESTDGPQATTWGFDGTDGWVQGGGLVADLSGFRLRQATKLNDLGRPVQLKTRYTNLTSGRPTRLPASTPTGTPVDVNLIQGNITDNVTERLYFDASSGVLLRRQIITRTPLNGSLTETVDYSDYKPVAGVMMPFTIKRTNWNTLDTLTVVDVKPGAQIDDARFARPKG
jgi:hypothetical protein